MNMNVLNKFITLGLVLLTFGCASTVGIPERVAYDYDVNFDFTSLKTYDWHPMTSAAKYERLTRERIKMSVSKELQAKNLIKTSGNPDFLVNIYGIQISVYTTAWRGFDADLFIEKGKLQLSFIEPESGQVIWWGRTAAELDPDMDTEETNKVINEVVSRILQKYPPTF
jgi:hypothetical protein